MFICLFQLVKYLYIVREEKEFDLEEHLYAKLIFLYRSPETLIKVTRLSYENPIEWPRQLNLETRNPRTNH